MTPVKYKSNELVTPVYGTYIFLLRQPPFSKDIRRCHNIISSDLLFLYINENKNSIRGPTKYIKIISLAKL